MVSVPVPLALPDIFTLDRYKYEASQASKFTIQQNAGSVTPPAGFVNYLGLTTASAVSIGTSDYFQVVQIIEGLNIGDLAWGTASAKTVTLSFWVRSSLTGTFGGSLRNSAVNRSYPFSYTISSANTWEQKSITIAGDTSGTWLTTNGIGIRLTFGLGNGSTFSGTAGSWSGSNFQNATGATSVVGTLNATWYITGAQLEVGSVATPFERRDYGRELMMCQRYYEKSYNISVVPGTVTETGVAYTIEANSSGNPSSAVFYNVRKRASATITAYSPITGASGKVRNSGLGADENANVSPATPGENNFSVLGTTTTSGTPFRFHWVSSAEL